VHQQKKKYGVRAQVNFKNMVLVFSNLRIGNAVLAFVVKKNSRK
jgi:hypothetical protein